MVESIRFATSGRAGSTSTDSDRVSSCYEIWLVLSIVSVIRASSVLLAFSASHSSVISCSVVATSTRNTFDEVRCACRDRPGVPKVLLV